MNNQPQRNSHDGSSISDEIIATPAKVGVSNAQGPKVKKTNTDRVDTTASSERFRSCRNLLLVRAGAMIGFFGTFFWSIFKLTHLRTSLEIPNEMSATAYQTLISFVNSSISTLLTAIILMFGFQSLYLLFCMKTKLKFPEVEQG